MSTVSTSLVMLGPSGIGPFNSPEWRVGLTIQLVEGGTNGPYWLSAPREITPGPTRPDFLLIDSLDPYKIAKSLCLFLIAATVSPSAQGKLVESGFLVKTEHGIDFPAPWKFNKDSLLEELKSFSTNFRIGIVNLDEFSILDDSVCKELEKLGISSQLFIPKHS